MGLTLTCTTTTTTGRQCPVCPLTPTSATSITSHLTNYTHTLTHSMNCKTENVIYLWKCTKCGHNFDTNRSTNTHNVTNHQGTLYCGMTKRKFAARMAEHRDYAKFHKTEEPSGQHFHYLVIHFITYKVLPLKKLSAKILLF